MDEQIFETGVTNLICYQCEDILKNRFSYVRGIINVECSYFKGRIKITYDKDIIKEEQIKEIMTSSGFSPTSKSGKGKIYDLITLILILIVFFLLQIIDLPLIPKADNGTSYIMLFLIGLVTGTHCMVMCGGIMMSQTTNKKLDGNTIKTRLSKVILYNLGRVLMASILGLIFGLIGKKLIFSMKAKSMIFTFTGCYIILLAFAIWGVPIIRKIQTQIPSLCNLKKKNKKFKNMGPFIAGILTALLPCASSNSMWMLAASSGSAIKGMFTMLAWSLGTVPFMILFGMFSSFKGLKHGLMIRLNIVLMMSLGLNLAYMGICMML